MRRLAIRSTIVGGAVCFVVGLAVYFSLAGLIDDRLYGERERSLPRVYARPIEIRRGQTFTQQDLIARLNDIGYAQRPDVAQPGEFAITRNEIAITPRTGNYKGQRVRVVFPATPKNATTATRRGIQDDRGGGRGPRRRRRARSAGPDGADDVAARGRSGAARRSPASRSTCSRRCWPSRTAASTRTRASTRCA